MSFFANFRRSTPTLPAKPETIIKFPKDLTPMDEWIIKVQKSGRIIASNKRVSQKFDGRDLRFCKKFLPCWTGTLVAYVEPDVGFGRTVEDIHSRCRWIFPVPEKYQGKKDALLIAEPLDYMLERDGNARIVRAAKVYLIERFPAESGWYRADPLHDIPHGRRVARCKITTEIDPNTGGPPRDASRGARIDFDDDVRFLYKGRDRGVVLVTRSYTYYDDPSGHYFHRVGLINGLAVLAVHENRKEDFMVWTRASHGREMVPCI